MTGLEKSAGLTPEVKVQIESKVAEIVTLMPWLVGLSANERQAAMVVGRKSTQFVQRAVESVRQNPEMAPSFLDAEKLDNRFKLYNDLLAILEPVQSLERMISDSMMVAGSEAFSDALDYYNTVKRAAKSNVPGAQAVVDNLKTRFSHANRKKAVASIVAEAGQSGG